MTEKNETGLRRTRLASEFEPVNRWLSSPLQLSRLFSDPMENALATRTWSPAVEVAESDEGYAVTVELPGSKKEDVSVDCHEGTLTIKGEKKSEREENTEHRHFVERRYGSFSRIFKLPADAATERVNAKFEDGVLTVEIPRAEEKKPKVIPIH